MTVAGRRIETLEDLSPAPGGLLFVGLSPSPVSVASGHYHQGRLGRRFWSRLIQAGLLPPDTDVSRADDALVAAGHGITDLTKEPRRRNDATDEQLRAGVGLLWQRTALSRPGAVVFIHKRAAEMAAGRPLPATWGALDGVALAARPCFLMPAAAAPPAEVEDALNFLRNLGHSIRVRPRDRLP